LIQTGETIAAGLGGATAELAQTGDALVVSVEDASSDLGLALQASLGLGSLAKAVAP